MSEFQTLWYHARHEDAEHWFGAKATRDEAIAHGRTEYDGEPFFICSGQPMKHDLTIFDEDLDSVVCAFQNRNEELFGEDGQGDPESEWSDVNRDTLVYRLNQTFAQWAEECGYDKAYFLDMQQHEAIAALPTSEEAGA